MNLKKCIMEKKGKHLTIMITTFNRRERLLRTLHQIEQQGYFEQYCILISDNCSDYDVKDMLDKEFEPPFRKRRFSQKHVSRLRYYQINKL